MTTDSTAVGPEPQLTPNQGALKQQQAKTWSGMSAAVPAPPAPPTLLSPEAYRLAHSIVVTRLATPTTEAEGAATGRSSGGGKQSKRKRGRRSDGDTRAREVLTCWEPAQSWDACPFEGKLLQTLRQSDFLAPTPIQATCWPIAAAGHDVVAVAKTGSGKTLSYLLPIFARAAAEDAGRPGAGGCPFAVVLAPTRELAVQIYEQAATFGSPAGMSSTVIYGGASREEQMPALRAGPCLVVATPGRLVDFLTERPIGIRLQQTAVLVLDEADRMLEMGFAPSLHAVARAMPPTRQTLMFTATWPKKVQQLARGLQRGGAGAGQAMHVMLGGAEHRLVANAAIAQHVHRVSEGEEREQLLLGLLDALLEDQAKTCIVFVNRKAGAEELASRLR
jgi:ATP-dependent RNA helicase DDX5/DBP2